MIPSEIARTPRARSSPKACKEVCTRLHACTPRKTHAHRPLPSLQDGSNQAAPTPPAGYAPRKVLIYSGIWRKISENPCQKISKYSPNLTKYKHTKRVRVQSKQGNTSPSPQNDQIGPEGGRVYIPPKTSARLHAFYAYQGVEDDGAQRPRKIARGGPARPQAPRRHRRRGRQRLPAPRTRRARNLRPSGPDEEGSTQ